MTVSNWIKVTVALTTAAVVSACGTHAQENTAPPAPSVSVAEVIEHRLTEWDEFTGRLEAPQNVELRPRVSGYIDIVAFEEGDIVTAGEPLFFIENKPFKAEVRRLEAELMNAHAQKELAISEAKRAENLLAKNAISEEIADSRRAQLKQATARVSSVDAALELARLNLSYTRVEAPISGRVSRATFTKGNYVTAGQSVLTNLASTDKVYAYFDADEQTYLHYVKLAREGSRPSSREHENLVLMGLASDKDYPYQGHIDFLDNRVNPSSGTIRGRAVFDNDGQFIPGLFARLKLVGSASYNGILIDDKAIGTDLSNKFVLVLDNDNKVQYRAVTLGEKVNGLRIIKSGLQAGERIVVNGLQRVRPGSAVTPEEVPMAEQAKLQSLQVMQQIIDENRQRPTLAQQQQDTVVIGG
ncbi:efflux RND transporter periplasmic adaptor subunit [Planctobacterium marinum]|uniref:efflux RND transporter periplasmic adaptor subunit n=1 Tax=Planctobacterium marinum TaxID=1631968 RepID=UPI001E4A6FD9|nr:efflux RND transporter periplasmic adaptor subunit [Planctobacterium marinum]MCC2607398.1 efflux RND transporter periplasmic adaptor subunit [Planctobacterium marinum]